MNNRIKSFVFSYILILYSFGVSAQSDTVYISAAQSEELFLRMNLQLLAEKFNIDKAEAAIVQAKLWPNPVFTLEPVNLWATSSQKEGRDEVVSPLFGSFGRNTALSAEMEQKIPTAGKRGKLLAAERISKDIAEQYFEELLRNLKIELRNTCGELIYLQEYQKVIEKQSTGLYKLVENQRRQQEQGNVSKSKLLRMEASALEIRSEYSELQREINRMQKNLKILLNFTSPAYIYITELVSSAKSPDSLSYDSLVDIALDSRPDLKASLYQSDYYEKILKYEKAQRVPDLSLKAGYDRAGNIIKNFVGFGFGIDLPLFNRNQGKIKEAQANIRQNATEVKHLTLVATSEVEEALKNYCAVYALMQKIGNENVSEADGMLTNYTKNFIDRNIGIVEFLDFFDAYKTSKKKLLEAKRNLYASYEELKFAVGAELF